MAKDNGNGSVTVVSGDTLYGIANTYYSKYGKQAGCNSVSTYVNFLANRNGLKDNPNLIRIGQTIYLLPAGTSSNPSGSTSTTSNATKVTITSVRLKPDTDRTVIAEWEFDNTYVSHYQVQWWGGTITDTGSVRGEPVNGDEGEKRTEKWATWDVPSNYVRANVRVKPVSRTYESNGQTVSYFIGQWSAMDQVDTGDDYNTQYNFGEYAAIGAPGAPSVEIEDFTLTATLDNIPDNVKYVQFQVARDNGGSTSVIADSGNIAVSANSASYSTTIEAGGKYKVRARYINENGEGAWSSWSGSGTTKPLAPAGIISCEAKTMTSVRLTWHYVANADNYTIQYTDNPDYFAGSDALTNVSTEKTNSNTPEYTLTNLEAGKTYYFRVRAENSEGSSEWTDYVSCVLGTTPVAPTTWSSLNIAVTGEPLTLYWVHNSKDGSLQSKAVVEATVKTLVDDGQTSSIPKYVLFVSGADVTSAKMSTVVREVEYCVVYNDFLNPNDGILKVEIQYCQVNDSEDGTVNEPNASTIWIPDRPSFTEGESIWYRYKFTLEGGDVDYREPVRVYSEEDFVDFSSYEVKWTNTIPTFEDGTYVWCRFKHSNLDDGTLTYGDQVRVANLTELESLFDVDPDKNYQVVIYTAEIETAKPEGTEDIDDERTMYCNVRTSSLIEGAIIDWKVCTAGITGELGEWSIIRTVNVYAPPELVFNIPQLTEDGLVLGFPLEVHCTSGPKSQTPIAYHLSIVSNTYYETIDDVGRNKMVYPGDEIYSEYHDTNSYNPTFVLSANNIDLENYASYTAKCVVSMDSGLTGEYSGEFMVAWDEIYHEPNAELSINKDNLTALIRPYCKDEDGNLIEGVKLSVYRREFDGSFAEVVKGLDNMKNIFVTDPHPALDYARYRIVAVTENTGAISYVDLPGYPVGEKGTVFQWNEEWSTYDVNEGLKLSDIPWSGSMLKLMYNIDISDDHKPDVSLIKYVGREHPVTYYGTQKGHTASWSMEIPKTDKDTLYAVRRLANWMGDVYVREPSGTGYWANVTVSYSQTHLSTIIPIKLTVTRVEGGV